MWRNDRGIDEIPTFNILICSEDRVAAEDVHEAFVCHVRTSRGEGFMPSLRHVIGGRPGAGAHNGGVTFGTDIDAYTVAKGEALDMFADRTIRKERS